MAANNVGHKLYGLFKQKYNDHHSKPFRGSKYRDAAMLKGVVEDIGEAETVDLINFYFEHKSNHSFKYFIFNYDKLQVEKELRERDLQERDRLRERTRQRLNEMGVDLNSEV